MSRSFVLMANYFLVSVISGLSSVRTSSGLVPTCLVVGSLLLLTLSVQPVLFPFSGPTSIPFPLLLVQFPSNLIDDIIRVLFHIAKIDIF